MVVHAYVCVHDTDRYLRAAVKVAMARLCPGIRVGPKVATHHHRHVFAVDATSAEALRYWIRDLNAECQRKCIHVVESPGDTVCRRRPAEGGRL